MKKIGLIVASSILVPAFAYEPAEVIENPPAVVEPCQEEQEEGRNTGRTARIATRIAEDGKRC